uniref:Uncharacterized protein n=1 Tax=Eptatretus burgeri TaxID=7764 RepID=A0A8C4QTI1_EPTBU
MEVIFCCTDRSRLMHLMAFIPIITIFLGLLMANHNISRIKNWLWPSIPSLNKSFNGLYTEFKGNFEDWLASTWISAPRAPGPSDVSACAIEVLSEMQSTEEAKQSKEISNSAEPNDSGHSSCNCFLHPLLMNDLSVPLVNGKLYLCAVEKNLNCDSRAASVETNDDLFQLTVAATNPAERKNSCQNLPYIAMFPQNTVMENNEDSCLSPKLAQIAMGTVQQIHDMVPEITCNLLHIECRLECLKESTGSLKYKQETKIVPLYVNKHK